jgi:TatD DNase family protein
VLLTVCFENGCQKAIKNLNPTYFCAVLTDTHAHLYSEKFASDRESMIDRAIQAGVSRLFLPNIDRESILPMLDLAQKFPENCFPMMGVHPCSIGENYIEELAIAEDWLNKASFCAIGEIGIDLYWDKTFLKQQQIAFAQQIDWAKARNLPIVIHSRNAFQACYEIVKEKQDGNLKGIFHCFSDGIREADLVLGLGGFMLGIGGVVTFKNSGLDAVVRHVGIEHLLLETDAPYLAPVPFRGKRNESAYIVPICQQVAEFKNMMPQDVAKATTENSKRLFGC